VFREDYLLRSIQQVTAAIGEILGLSRLQKYPQALAEVDRALQSFAGLNLSLVTALPAPELVEMTRFGERLDVGKLIALADLLQAEGDIYTAQALPAEAAERYLKALELTLEVAFASEHNLLPAAPRVAGLAERLSAVTLPPDLGEWLAHYQELVRADSAGGESPAAE
jgi:hypothetical protein